MSEQTSIFLHGMWRCGSTYIWSKFRQDEALRCYYEPLHHGLVKLTAERIARDVPEVLESNRHPSLSLPYFSEFEPLLKSSGRGVGQFKKSLAYDDFILAPSAQHKTLHSYLSFLIEHAGEEGRAPVLGLNRSVLRMGWMKQNFGGTHIFIRRDPRALWWSYKRYQMQGNETYFTAWLRVIDHNRDHAAFRELAERLRLTGGLQKFLQKEKRYYSRVLNSLNDDQTYAMVYRIAQLVVQEAEQYADVALDMSRGDDPAYIQSVAEKIESRTSTQVDFSDFSQKPLAQEASQHVDFNAVEQAA